MKISLRILFAIAALLAFAAHTIGAPPPTDAVKTAKNIKADFYVSTAGRDTWSGKLAAPNADKTDGPFASLERARDAIRQLKTAGALPARPITVAVRGGSYSLKRGFTLVSQDSGSAAAPIVYRSLPGETVCLSGGPVVSPASFTPVTDPKVLGRLEPAVRGKVVQANLRALGIQNLGQFPVSFSVIAGSARIVFQQSTHDAGPLAQQGLDQHRQNHRSGVESA